MPLMYVSVGMFMWKLNEANADIQQKSGLKMGVEVFEKGNLNDQELSLAVRVIEENIDILNDQFDRFIEGKKVKMIQLKVK